MAGRADVDFDIAAREVLVAKPEPPKTSENDYKQGNQPSLND
jgi:hypothetical protein